MSHVALLAALVLLFASPKASAVIIDLLPVDMRTACDGCQDPPANGSFTEFIGLSAVNPAWLSDLGGIEQRSGLEFDVGSLGPGIIHSARLLLTVRQLTGAPVVQIHGYAGDGSIDLADMTVSNLLHTTAPITATGGLPGPVIVTSFVQATQANDFVGFMFRDTVFGSSVLFQFTGGNVPRLRLDFEAIVAEPVGMGIAALAAGVLARRRARVR